MPSAVFALLLIARQLLKDKRRGYFIKVHFQSWAVKERL